MYVWSQNTIVAVPSLNQDTQDKIIKWGVSNSTVLLIVSLQKYYLHLTGKMIKLLLQF
jgi:hypothetical protein